MSVNESMLTHLGYSLLIICVILIILSYIKKFKVVRNNYISNLKLENSQLKRQLNAAALIAFDIVKSTLWLRYLAKYNRSSENVYITDVDDNKPVYKFYYKCTKPAHVIVPKMIRTNDEQNITDESYLIDNDDTLSYDNISLNFQLCFKVYRKGILNKHIDVKNIIVELKYYSSSNLIRLKRNFNFEEADFFDSRISNFLNNELDSPKPAHENTKELFEPIMTIIAYDKKDPNSLKSKNIPRYICNNRYLKIDNGYEVVNNIISELIAEVYRV